MADEKITVAVETTGATAAAADLDKVGAAAERTGEKSKTAAKGVKDLGDTSGDTSSALSYFAQAASAMGLDGLAAGLDAATVALDAAEGATILFRTATESETVARIANSVATAANTAYTIAWAVAAGVAEAASIIWTAATYALGVAFRFLTGPIGIIITVVALLAAGIVYLYNNNETFRTIVQSVWGSVRAAIGAVIDWFKATVIPAFEALVSWSGWGTIGRLASAAFGSIKAAIDPVIGVVQDLIGAVQNVIGWISRIHFPSLPSWLGGGGDAPSAASAYAAPPAARYAARSLSVTAPAVTGFGRFAAPSVPSPGTLTAGGPAGTGLGMAGGTVVQVLVPPTANPVETGRQIVSMLRRYEANAGTSWRTA